MAKKSIERHKSKEYIMGRNCIHEVLNHTPSRILEVYTCQQNEDDSLYKELVKRGIKPKQLNKNKLTQLVQSESHQSYVAWVKERPYINLRNFVETTKDQEKSLVLMLDSIFDPQNLGTIMRAAECFGVDLVIFSKNRGADITPTVTKTSSGATELVPICIVSNLADAMSVLQKEDFWCVCADVNKEAVSIYQYEFANKTVIVMGSEKEGVRPLIKKKCDQHLFIPMHGQIDSLNVSQATAVFLNSYQNQHSDR